MSTCIAAAQCSGTTRAGHRCSITSLSKMRDSAGRLVADPLRKGGLCCTLHTVLFCIVPVQASESIIAYIDLETNSLDVLSGRIVEVGALIHGSYGKFSTVVHPGSDSCPDVTAVHGIPHDELLSGPCFAEAFGRLDAFLRYASLSVPESDGDSDDDPVSAAAMKQDLDIMLVAHNGAKFDFPFLLCECLRAGFGSSAMAGWMYADTLHLLQATDSAGECNKLQCALRACSGPHGLRAHRALDDCIALEQVVTHVSESLGVTPWVLLRPIVFRLDQAATVAQMMALMAP